MLKILDNYFFVDDEDVLEHKTERNLFYIVIGIGITVVAVCIM